MEDMFLYSVHAFILESAAKKIVLMGDTVYNKKERQKIPGGRGDKYDQSRSV